MSINDENLLAVVAAKDEALAQKDRQIVELQLMVKSKQQQLDVSMRQCEQLLRRLYGPKSEKFDPDQPFLELIMADVLANAESAENAGQELNGEDEEPQQGEQEETGADVSEPAADPESSAPDKPRKKSRRNGRVPIPDWVQRRIIEVDVDEEQKIDLETGEPLARLGYNDTIKLEVIPGKLQANVYRRWKYGPVRDAKGRTRIIIPELPRFALGSCKADAGLMADVIVAKTCDHMPLYRQEQKSEREGLRLPRTTAADWYLKSAELMQDLYGLQLTATRSAPILKTDATRLPLFIPGNGKTHSAAIWVWIGADGVNTPELAFQYTFDQTKERPAEFVAECPETLEYFQADAASVYDQLLQTGSFTEAGCWSHARRYWFDAIAGAPLEAAHVLGEIRLLYRIEDEIRERKPEERQGIRQARSAPIVARLYSTFAEWETAALPKSPMGQALTYFRNQREALHRYLLDGRLDIDNNDCEREFRYVATGRRNWLFVGSERGARAFAVHLTMVRNCAHRGINPLEYYSDVLRRIPVQPRDRLEELLPANWKAGPALPDRIVMPAMYSTDRAPPR
jgi:transposase